MQPLTPVTPVTPATDSKPPMSLTTPPAVTARRLLLEAEEAEKDRQQAQRIALQQALRSVIQEMNLPALQRLADVAVRQAGFLDAMPKEIKALRAATEATAKTTTRLLRWQILGLFVAVLLLTATAAFTVWAYTLRQEESRRPTATLNLPELGPKMAAAEKTAAELARLQSELAATKKQRDAMQAQIKDGQDAVARLSAGITALGQAREQAQTEILRLQRIQQTFQFKLLEGRSGMVFVEIPETAEPFKHNGKRLIAVTPEDR